MNVVQPAIFAVLQPAEAAKWNSGCNGIVVPRGYALPEGTGCSYRFKIVTKFSHDSKRRSTKTGRNKRFYGVIERKCDGYLTIWQMRLKKSTKML